MGFFDAFPWLANHIMAKRMDHHRLLLHKLLPVLFEDDYLLAVDKPAGMDVSGKGVSKGLTEMLAAPAEERPTLIPANRLSRYESGVLLFGKDPAMLRHLRTGLRTGHVHQEYLAVVQGSPSQKKLIIDTRHGSSRGRTRSPHGRQKQPPADRLRAKKSPITREATVVTSLQTHSGRTLVRCHTTVGTTHALRAQLRAVDLRLLGDTVRTRPSHAHAMAPSQTHLHLAKLSFHHPHQRHRLTISAAVPAEFAKAVQRDRNWEAPLRAGLLRRISLLTNTQTDAYRLITGSVEDASGLTAERYGSVVVLQVTQPLASLQKALPTIARWYRQTLGVQAVYAKERKGSHESGGTDATGPPSEAKLLAGRAAAPETTINEHGLQFVVRPCEGFSAGLFLDQRDNRQRIRQMAPGRDVLNLFAYTCGFSVAAAAGGARSVTSVDIAPKALDWGKTNFRANAMDPAGFVFIRSTAQEYLVRARRQDRFVDLIVIDAPTFSRDRRRKRNFSLTRDLPTLIAAASDILRPGGVIMVSINYRRLSLRGLRERIKTGAAKRRHRVLMTPALPVDFAADPDHAKTLFLRFE